METDAARAARLNAEREQELKRVPLQTIDKSKWPKDVRPISMSEAGGLGIDPDGRLYWNGKPVEIIGRRDCPNEPGYAAEDGITGMTASGTFRT